jgi:hypothetical protein
MLKSILVALTLVLSTAAFAGELDGDKGVANGQNLNGTVVFRVDVKTGEVAVASTSTAMKSKEQAEQFALAAEFKTISKQNVRGELDNAAGSSSWYYYNPYTYGYGYGYGYGYAYGAYSYGYGYGYGYGGYGSGYYGNYYGSYYYNGGSCYYPYYGYNYGGYAYGYYGRGWW